MINVVIGIITYEDKILMIKRERGDFIGLYGLPGGKVEECEHIDTAIESDKIMIESFHNNKESNYIKLDCYRDETGKYFWK